MREEIIRKDCKSVSDSDSNSHQVEDFMVWLTCDSDTRRKLKFVDSDDDCWDLKQTDNTVCISWDNKGNIVGCKYNVDIFREKNWRNNAQIKLFDNLDDVISSIQS